MEAMSADGHDEIILTATDLADRFSYHLPLSNNKGLLDIGTTGVREGGAICLHTDSIHKVCASLPADALITITSDKERNTSAVLRLEGAEHTVSAAPVDEFPAEIPEGEFKPCAVLLAEDFVNSLLQVRESASADENYRALHGIYYTNDEGSALVATNGHILSFSRIAKDPANLPEGGIIISYKASRLLDKVLNRNEALSIFVADERKFILFKQKGRKYTSRLVTGRFPDYERVVPSQEEFGTILRADAPTLLKSLKQACGLSNYRSPCVSLILERGCEPTLRSDTSTFVLECGWEGNEIKIGFNPQYLLRAIKPITAGKVKIEFTSPDRAARITGENSPDYYAIVMPKRI
jgi:DNA polymerase-3 subunit beta